MCYTYDKSKGGDTREIQSKMVPPKKTGSSHLKTDPIPQVSPTCLSPVFNRVTVPLISLSVLPMCG